MDYGETSMDATEAQAALREAHIKAGFKLITERADYIDLEAQGGHFRISQALIAQFADYQGKKAARTFVTLGAGYCTPDAREHVVLATGRQRLRTREEKPLIFGDPNGQGPYGQFGDASLRFACTYLLKPHYLELAFEQAEYFNLFERQKRKKRPAEISVLYRRPRTMLLERLSQPTVEHALVKSAALIDACLFHASFARGRPWRLADEWPAPSIQRQDTIYPPSRIPDDRPLGFPTAKYNADLLRFYNLGLSSDVPELQFLAFYQVLEFFFLNVSDERLYAVLARRIHDPGFRATSDHLDRIIMDVTRHNKVTDETEMLKLVMAKYTPHEEVLRFLDDYQRHLGTEIYWQKAERFGSMMSVNREANHTFGDVARIIKQVRNALVHSSDRHERAVRHVPFSATSEMIRREVPLIKFLAERAIVGSALAFDD